MSGSAPSAGGEPAVGVVIEVFRGGCTAVCAKAVHELRLAGRHAREELRLAVGDEVHFDAASGALLERRPRRTQLARARVAGRRRDGGAGAEQQVIAANMDRVAIVAAAVTPPFRAGAVDRFMLAAAAGGLEALLVVNKIDQLEGGPLPREIAEYRGQLPLLEVSAASGSGVPELRAALAGSRTVLAGHSGVGKSSLLNALAPELRLEVGALRRRDQRGRHTTTAATWVELAGGAVVVDTPGVREIGTGAVDPAWLDAVFPDVHERAQQCRFGDCAHGAEPSCAVQAAVAAGELAPARLARYRRLRAEVDPRASRRGGAELR
jgi:ribosome biogenesis GTPase / thiamine phosphate phosphatase